MTSLAPILQAFFTERLIGQRRASGHTINSYRDTFRLLLAYADAHLNIRPSQLRLEDLDAPFLSGFLTHLESDRGNSARTRNARLTAIRSLFRFAALRAPEQAALIARVLAIPERKTDRALVCFLTRLETQALLDSPDRDTASGPPRPRSAHPGRPDRATGFRDHCLGLRRSGPDGRSARAVLRERPQGTHHPTDPADRRRAARMAG